MKNAVRVGWLTKCIRAKRLLFWVEHLSRDSPVHCEFLPGNELGSLAVCEEQAQLCHVLWLSHPA